MVRPAAGMADEATNELRVLFESRLNALEEQHAVTQAKVEEQHAVIQAQAKRNDEQDAVMQAQNKRIEALEEQHAVVEAAQDKRIEEQDAIIRALVAALGATVKKEAGRTQVVVGVGALVWCCCV